MDIKEEEDLKKEFQLERVVLFTDAVFAIILTIMVLDLKIPEGVGELTGGRFDHVYKDLAIKFAGYALTFALVARFWMVHLNLFRYLKDYDRTLLVFNLAFLFAVSLFPFAVPLITGNIHIDSDKYSWGLAVYICIVYSVVFMQALIAVYLFAKKGALVLDSPNLEANLQIRIQRINLFLVPVLIIVVIILCNYQLPYVYVLGTTVGYGAVVGRMTRKIYPVEDDKPLLMRLYGTIRESRKKKQLQQVKRKKKATTV